MSLINAASSPRVGLVLTGGGARAAYQVGVLQAISAALPKKARNPFPVICGTSAGAFNAASLALSARNFHEGVRRLSSVWENAHVNQAIPLGPNPGYMATPRAGWLHCCSAAPASAASFPFSTVLHLPRRWNETCLSRAFNEASGQARFMR